jgi:hypothetical protein
MILDFRLRISHPYLKEAYEIVAMTVASIKTLRRRSAGP